jgi:hypothetical protein
MHSEVNRKATNTDTDTQKHRQESVLISLLLFFQKRKID